MSNPKSFPGHILVFGLACTALSACVGGDQLPSATTVSDSAGIRIVDHSVVPEGLPRWTVAGTPRVSIGSVAGTGPDAFGRIASVASRATGGVAVADGATLEIKAFDGDGRHLWTAGGRGEGPGKLSNIASVFTLSGDSVVVVGRGIADVFDGSGRFSRRLRWAVPDGLAAVTIEGVLADGFVGWARRAVLREAPPNGTYRDPMVQLYFDRDGGLVHRGIELAGTEFYAAMMEGGSAYVSMTLPWGRRTQLRSAGDWVFATSQDRFEVVRTDANGAMEMLLRVAAAPLPIDDAARSRLTSGLIDGNRPLPDAFPAIRDIHVDAERNIWVREFVPPFESRPANWWVLNSDGLFLAEAGVPDGFEVRQIGSHEVLGVTTDSLGVAYVELRAIAK